MAPPQDASHGARPTTSLPVVLGGSLLVIALLFTAWTLLSRPAPSGGIEGGAPQASAADSTYNAVIEDGMRQYLGGDYDRALATFQRAVKVDPSRPLGHNNVGATLNALRRWDEAIAALSESLRLDPSFELARNNMAWALEQKRSATPAPPASAARAGVEVTPPSRTTSPPPPGAPPLRRPR